MSIASICRQVACLRKQYGEKDPLKLAEALGIIVDYFPMGTNFNSCKGFFLYQSRTKHITINSQLPEAMQRIILAHEIGHAVLHYQVAQMGTFHDFTLFENLSKYEYEANLFAAEYLLTDQLVLEKLNEDNFFFAVAQELAVPPELLDFKFRILKQKGWQIKSPIQTKSCFLKDFLE